jgi:CDP-diglyceride synthetase
LPSTKLAPAPKKKSSTMIRVVSSVMLISFQCLCYAAGHLYYSLLLLWCGFKCYFELIAINRNVEKDAKNNYGKFLDWYVPLMHCFFLLPRTFVRRILVDNDNLFDFRKQTPILYEVLFVQHKLICSLGVIFGLVVFTLSLRKG